MKRSKFSVLMIVMVVAVLAASCAQPAPAEEPAAVESESAVEEPAEESVVDIPEEGVLDARFSIQADADLQGALTALYSDVFGDEEVVFVNEGADVLAASVENPIFAESNEVPAVFLPGYALKLQSDNSDALSFIDFAISADGQMVLILEGLLPESIKVVDQGGENVEVRMPVYNVISAHGPTTFMFYAVGAADRLVGASYLGARDPNGAAALERIDPKSVGFTTDELFSQEVFSIEEAIQLDPNLVAAT
ncbi:MAG: hypothetical protein JXA25_17555, partial [Anaerolineales bacterium]|nr:hypothetical protein [Anaerolineales bacterium]